MSQSLYYIHDPMCSWCWGFRPAWLNIKAGLAEMAPDITPHYILGGLAPDTDEPMPLSTQEYIRANWRRIQEVIPNTEFNEEFWEKCQPRRSTYPACRAVIAAKQLDAAQEDAMILAIQQAYYLQAKNPSDESVLRDCALSIGLDEQQFLSVLHQAQTHQRLLDDISTFQSLSVLAGVSGFPSLVFRTGEREPNHIAVPIDYNKPSTSLEFIRLQL